MLEIGRLMGWCGPCFPSSRRFCYNIHFPTNKMVKFIFTRISGYLSSEKKIVSISRFDSFCHCNCVDFVAYQKIWKNSSKPPNSRKISDFRFLLKPIIRIDFIFSRFCLIIINNCVSCPNARKVRPSARINFIECGTIFDVVRKTSSFVYLCH